MRPPPSVTAVRIAVDCADLDGTLSAGLLVCLAMLLAGPLLMLLVPREARHVRAVTLEVLQPPTALWGIEMGIRYNSTHNHHTCIVIR